MSGDRFTELAEAMHAILRDLANDTADTDASALGAKAVARLYEEFPDLTLLELDAISKVYGPPEHSN